MTIQHLANGYCELEFEGKFISVEWREEEIWHDEYSPDFIVILENVNEIAKNGDSKPIGELPRDYYNRLVDKVYNAARDSRIDD